MFGFGDGVDRDVVHFRAEDKGHGSVGPFKETGVGPRSIGGFAMADSGEGVGEIFGLGVWEGL